MPYSLLGTLLDTTGEKLKHNVDLQDNWRKQKSQFLIDAIHAVDENGKPKMAPEQLETAYNELEKLNNQPGAKDVIKKFRDITTKLHSFGKPNPAMLQRAGDQTSQALSGQGGGNLVAPPATTDTTPQAIAPPDDGRTQSEPMPFTPPPPPRSDMAQAAPPAAPASTMPTPPPQRTSGMGSVIATGSPAAQSINTDVAKQNAISNKDVETSKRKYQDRYDLGVKMNLKGAQLAQFAQGTGAIMPASLAMPKKVGSYVGADKKVHTIMQHYDQDTQEFVTNELDSDGNVRDMRSTLAGRGISTKDAVEMAKSGQKFLDSSGQEIDLSKLRPNEELVPWVGDPNMKGKFMVVDQNTKQITADNLVRTYPALDPGSQTVQGVAKTGTIAEHEVPAVDAEGNPVAQTLESKTTPITGKVPAGAAGGVQAPPPKPTTPIGATSPGATRPLGAFQAGDRSTQLKAVKPIRAAATQLFGDPANPDFKPLEAYSSLANDPEAVSRIGSAARLIINDLSDVDKGSGLGVNILGQGASLESGGIWGAIKNTTGLTNWVAKSQVAATQMALDKLKPEELEYLNRVMAAYGTIVGLRTITGAGAYQFSTKSMEREIPILGIGDVKDSKSYNNKLASLAEEVVQGTKGVSDLLLPEKGQYKEAAARLAKSAKGSGPTPPPSRSTAPAATTAQTTDKIRVKGPNGQTGTVKKGTKLPTGWTEIK